MKNRWAQGIQPRNFAWVLKGQLAISERPGGQSRTHRKVRRQEEIVWLKQERFTRVVSTLPTEHNLYAYDDLGIPASHLAIDPESDLAVSLPLAFDSLQKWVLDGEKLLVHREDVGEQLLGIMAGFLLHTDRVQTMTQALSVMEHMFGQQIGPEGRIFVRTVAHV